MDTVILDFGNVVVRWDVRALFEQFLEGAELDRFLADVLTPAENLRCDLGTPLADVVADLLDRHPQHEEPLLAWRDRWIETIPGPIPGTEGLIEDVLASGLRLLGLSNFSAETFPLCRSRYPIFDRFHDIVISGEVGIAKPDPAIYRLVCERNGIAPADAVFLDDSEPNVVAAREVGMTAFVFTTATAARRDLASVGIVLGR